MRRGHNRRQHKRQVCNNQVVTLRSAAGSNIFVLLIDQGAGGLGCVYSGKNPPKVGYTFGVQAEGGARQVEVVWVDELGRLKYRLGLMYLDLPEE